VASSQIENLSRRDKFWFHPVVGLVYDTKAEQLEKVLADLREMLAAEPRVQTRDARVQLARLGPSSLEIEVFAYVRAADRPGFDAIQEELLLKIIRIVEAAGTSLAFPSQTIYVRRDDRGAATTT
jgi:MscS family membrane protein